MWDKARIIVLSGAAAALASCVVGPNYQPPKADVPGKFTNAAPAESGSPADLSVWWRQFNDPVLDRLIDEALAANLDVMSAVSRIAQAREQETIQGAAGLPSANALGSALRLHSNSNPFAQLFGGAAGGQRPSGSSSSGSSTGSESGAATAAPASGSSGGTNLKFYSVGFDATWEIDLFGGVARNVESANAKEEAAVWALRDAEVTLTAEVARDYFSLRADQGRIAIINTELERQRNTVAVVTAKAQTGFVTYLDVNQLTAQEADTASQIPPLEAQANANIDALGVLLGRTPESLVVELSQTGTSPGAPAALPVGLPAELIRRRPDIREAERYLASATAEVGAAVAQLYPKLDLIGLASFGSMSFGSLLSTKNLSYGGLGDITWPIFTAGRLQANVRVNKDLENQAYYTWRASVLKALQDTEDALARYDSDQRRLTLLQQEVTAGNSSVTIAQQQYSVGLTDYLNVLTAQTTLLKAEDEVAQTRNAAVTDLVSLYKALGGGWTEAIPAETGPATAAAGPS